MKLDIKGSMPKKIDVMELFARDGIQPSIPICPSKRKYGSSMNSSPAGTSM